MTSPPRSRLFANLVAILFLVVGLLLTGGGVWLAVLGGSLFYLAAGLGIVAAGALLLARHRAALPIYAVVLAATLVWAVVETGCAWWALACRGDIIYPMALLLLLPTVTRTLTKGAPASNVAMTGPLWAGVGVGFVVLAVSLFMPANEIDGRITQAAAATLGSTVATPMTAAAPPQTANQPSATLADSQPDEDWRAYGRTQAGQRYSPVGQITPANVEKLKVAWTFRTGDLATKNDPVETTFEVTPIKVRDTLYLCSQHQRLFALDAASGKLRWSYNPKVQDNPTFQHLTCRGVSYHEDAATAAAPLACARTVFLPVNDGRMIALDADSGKLCEDFANHGTLDLQEGMGIKTAGFYEPTSPPVVGDKVIVVAGSITDNYSSEEPSGVIRGFDVHTGKLVWAWDSGAQDENALPSATHSYTNNSPNSWITASYDPKLGLVYMPMGVHTPDIWGGNRPALSERYSSALVALDIDTGRRVWSYQTVHHDLWDMDVPSQPTLADLTTNHGIVPAIMVPTKTGNLFVLDRSTGTPIVPAPERAVPQGPAPGDYTSPTQPFSELTFRPEKLLTGADTWGATIFDQLACRIIFKSLRYEGTFTPPSLQGTLVFPGNLGMFEWGGIAYDPVRQIVIANPMALPFVSTLIPRGPDNPSDPAHGLPSGKEAGVQPMFGTPYGVNLHAFLSPLGLPCKAPPWGFMAAIDMKTRKIAWMHRNGTIRDSSPVPIPIKMGVPTLGGPLTTAGGVAFLTSTLDDYIRAYDVTDGTQLWEDRLPAGGQSTPMSYAVDGRQFVVTAAGGHGSFGTKLGDYVIAYSLPGTPSEVVSSR